MVTFLDCTFEKPLPVMVVGDLMLDAYTIGQVRRISPEAPVTVLHVEREEERPGGASNVMLNLVSLGLQVIAIGRIGPDRAGKALKEALWQEGVDVDGVIVQEGYLTPRKERLIARQQQMLRVDRENLLLVDAQTEEALLQIVAEKMEDVRVVAISDYAKGLMTPSFTAGVIALANSRGIPVLIDPKGTDFTKYRNAWLIKPNLSEAMQFATKETPTLEKVAQALIERTNVAALLVTRAEEGCSLFQATTVPEHFPVKVRQVIDVTGAGDTVLATLVFARAHHLPLPEAVQLSNIAAGMSVECFGCTRISLGDLLRNALEHHVGHKIYDERHMGILQIALKSHAYSLLVVDGYQEFSATLFRAIRTMPQPLVVCLEGESHPEFLQLLASLQEVTCIFHTKKSGEALCRTLSPQKCYLFRDMELNELVHEELFA